MFRSRPRLVVIGLFYGFIFLLAVGAALNPGVPVAGRIACGAVAAAIAGLARLSWRAGVAVRADAVIVRRYSGTVVSVPWRDVHEIALVPNGKGGAWIAVKSVDGKALKTQGLAVNSMSSDWGHQVVAELEAARRSFS